VFCGHVRRHAPDRRSLRHRPVSYNILQSSVPHLRSHLVGHDTYRVRLLCRSTRDLGRGRPSGHVLCGYCSVHDAAAAQAVVIGTGTDQHSVADAGRWTDGGTSTGKHCSTGNVQI